MYLVGVVPYLLFFCSRLHSKEEYHGIPTI